MEVGKHSLENVSLSERTTELEANLVRESAARGVLEKDISWILRDGLGWVLDRVIESPQFLEGLVHVQASYVAADVEQGKRVGGSWGGLI